MITIHRNKMSLKDQAEDIVVDWSDDIINFLNENDPKYWRKIINELQYKFCLFIISRQS